MGAAALSPILFLIFMERISKCSKGKDCVQLGNLRIASLPFPDYVVLSAIFGTQYKRFTVEWEGIKINTSKSKAMVLCLKTVGYLPLMGTELMPQAKKVKHFRVLPTSDRKMERKMDRWFGKASVITQGLYQTIKVGSALGCPRKSLNLWWRPGIPCYDGWMDGRTDKTLIKRS